MQTAVENNLAVGLAGQIADNSNRTIVTKINNSKQRVTVTVTAADKKTVLTVNDSAFSVNDASASKTIAELVGLLETAVEAGSEEISVITTDSVSLTLESDVSGADDTYTGTTNCSIANVVAKAAAAAIPAGVLVCNDVVSGKEDNCKLPAGATDITTASNVAGIATRSQFVENADSGDTYLEKEQAVNVMQNGSVYVPVETAVTPSSPVYVRFQGTGQNGAFRGDSASGDAALLASARFASVADAGGIAKVKINLP